ncbi:uncharacterized protein LOC108670031 [Hyalella azteca]|uniref:Uncharacterized protein LOC108670031 n=1 Tax=Hyalella azteca TaxID=294128 RepID=A0A8B7NH66_HYAAZ|nr:uncharacterized protein LOC108670031 [Hyalella azteca]
MADNAANFAPLDQPSSPGMMHDHSQTRGFILTLSCILAAYLILFMRISMVLTTSQRDYLESFLIVMALIVGMETLAVLCIKYGIGTAGPRSGEDDAIDGHHPDSIDNRHADSIDNRHPDSIDNRHPDSIDNRHLDSIDNRHPDNLCGHRYAYQDYDLVFDEDNNR